jgi:NRPS condensation-like uncharacterized protein
MSAFDSPEPTPEVTAVLAHARSKGVRLWAEQGQLRYKAPPGALSERDIQRLKEGRGQILSLLARAGSTVEIAPEHGPRPQGRRIPLTFTQLAHWNLYRLQERPAIRQIVSATRLVGRLHLDALRRSVAEIVKRHEALRTRIVIHDGTPAQEIDECGAGDHYSDRLPGIDDLTTVPKDLQEAVVRNRIDEHILQPIDVSAGPLFGALLLKLRDDEHVLVVAMEHTISDAFSMGIFLRELFVAYTQTVRGQPVSLPAIPIQFPDYAVWQQQAQPLWNATHAAYWKDRLAGHPGLKFPVDPNPPNAALAGWAIESFQLGSALTNGLREWSRRHRSTLVLTAFTVYIALVLRWCDVPEAVIQYQVDARVDPRTLNTIGYFAAPVYLRIALLENDTFVDLLQRVMAEYCTASEHLDFCFLEAQLPRPAFTLNPGFNWVPSGSALALCDLEGTEHAIATSPVEFDHPLLRTVHRENEPLVRLFETAAGIHAGIYYPRNRFSQETMENFGRHFVTFARALLEEPQKSVATITLV